MILYHCSGNLINAFNKIGPLEECHVGEFAGAVTVGKTLSGDRCLFGRSASLNQDGSLDVLTIDERS